MQNITVTDRASYSITSREWTDQGYLKVPGTVARTGVQHYLARELGINDRKPDEVVNVYRPPEEVFNQDSLSSYADVDVTDDHPADLVDAESYRKVAVGHTTDAGRPEGENVVVDLIIKDADAIDSILKGKSSLSAGYTARYDYEPGQTADGEPYEFVQRDIKINHVALVGRARAGQAARLHDHQPSGGEQMATITLDGQTVTMDDDSKAQLIQKSFDELKGSYEEMEKKAQEMEDEAKRMRDEVESAKAEKDKMQEERDEYAAKAEDSAINERIKAVSDAQSSAAKIAGSEFTCDSVDIPTIQKEAMKIARPTVDWDNQAESYIKAAWDLELERSTEDRAHDSHQRFGDDLKKMYTTQDGGMVGDQAYDSFLSGQAN